MPNPATLSLRDQEGVLACLVLGTPADEQLYELADEALFAEIAGALVGLPEMTLPERIQHAFQAQRLNLALATAEAIANTLFYDGFAPVRDAQAVAA